MTGIDPQEAVVWYVVFLFSTTLHEAAHAWAGKKGGDLTAYLGGQVTLNPMPHISREPIGMVVLPIISLFIMGWPFGYASAPYDPHWAYHNHKKAAWMAMAGPASNFLLVLLSCAAIKIGLHMGYFASPDSISFSHLVSPTGEGVAVNICFLISIFCSLNLVLAVLNMMPLPPLDGSQIISFFLTQRQAAKYSEVLNNPTFGLIGLFIVWKIFSPIYSIAFGIMVSCLYPGMY